MQNPRYFYFIDLLRWVAAMAVLIHHYKSHFKVSSISIENSKIFSLIIDNAIIGSYGVWFFWCVSGFVFTNILINKKVTLFEFSIKRFARLYPLHFLTLIIITLLELYSLKKFGNYQIESNIYDLYHFILNLFFISEWGFQDGFSFNSVIWSVSIEIPVYFTFFFLIMNINKNQFLVIFILLIIFKLLLHTSFFSYSLKACFFYFLLGSFLFLFCKKFEKFNKFFIILSLLGIFCWPFFSYLEKLDSFKAIESLIPSTLILFSSLIIFAFFIENYYFKIGKKLSFLGDSSYAIYLTHMPIQILLLIFSEIGFFDIEEFSSYKIFILFLFLINLVSFLVFKYYENPMRKKLS